MADPIDIAGRKILVLGAGLWQLPYLEKARELGLEVYATDWAENALGRPFADVFQPIDLVDKEASLAFAKSSGIEAIFTAADIGVPTAAFIAAAMKLPYHSEELARNATDKLAMRRAARDGGLSVPEFRDVTDLDGARAAAREIGYPCIVKPPDNCSSRGVFYLESQDELDRVFEESRSASKSGRLLIEEFMVGNEGSVEAVVHGGSPVILGTCDKEKSPLPYRYDLQLNYPGRYSPAQLEAIEDLVRGLVRTFHIDTGILHVEFLFQDGRARLIEFAVRGCGTNVITHLIPATTGFDCAAWLLRAAFGQAEPVRLPDSRAGILKFIMLPDKTIDAIDGFDAARASEGVVDLHLDRAAGERVGVVKDGRSRPGHIIASGDSLDEAQRNIDSALDKLKITFGSLSERAV